MGNQPSIVEAGTDTPKENFGDIVGTFDAKYIGSVVVAKLTGNDVCSDAVDRIKTMSIPERKVQIVVTAIGMFIIDFFTKATLKEVLLDDISFVTLDKQDKKIFSFLTASKLDPIIYCHTFTVKSRSHDIPIAINTAFKINSGEIEPPENFDDFRVTKKEALVASKTERPPEEAITDFTIDDIGDVATQVLAKHDGTYVGCIPVKKTEGKDVIASAEEAIRSDRSIESIKITIELSSLGLDLKKSNKELIRHIPISEVSFVAFDDEDDRHFSLITHDKAHGLMDCHIFDLNSHASKLPILIGHAHKAAEMIRGKVRSSSAQTMSAMKTRREEQLLFDPTQKSDHVVEPKTGEVLGVFEGRYLGRAPVGVAKGNKANSQVQHALEIVGKEPVPANDKVQLIISSEGIKILDSVTKLVVANVFIKNITFTTVTGKLNTIFAFIAKNQVLNRISCFLFATGSKSQDICSKVSEAFNVAVEEMKARNGNTTDDGTFMRGGNAFQAIKSVKNEIEGPLKNRLIPRGNLRPKKCIGAGKFGLIYIATLTVFKRKKSSSDRKDLVETEPVEWGNVQVLMMRGGCTEEEKMDFIHHAEVIADIKSPHVQGLMGVVLQQRPWMIAVENSEYGPMKDALMTWHEKFYEESRANPISSEEFYTLLLQVVQGLIYLHNKRIVHMGLTSSCILLCKGSKLKISGLDNSHSVPENSDSLRMTLPANLPHKWQAIESLKDREFSFRSDTWSFGVVCWEFFSYGAEPLGVIAHKNVLSSLISGVRYRRPQECPEDFFNLIYKCWDSKPRNRPALTYMAEWLKVSIEKSEGSSRDIGAIIAEN